ncbi:MAG: protein-export chaperone SecB [Gammaproteobacteria bacterium]|jgi:preprotein translocase subunit SecB
MAENEQPNEQAAAAQQEEQQGPNFSLQRLYLKDASFESPNSPDSFRGGQWRPQITFDIKSRNSKLQDELYEVVLILTVEAKQEDKVAFLVEVQQGAIFTCRGLEEPQLEQVLATVCPNIMFPYARETIDAMVVKGSFPPLMLAPVNFEALYAQSKQHEAQQAAASNGNGNGAAPEGGQA